MGLIDRAKRAVRQAVSKASNKGNVWDMSSREAREAQVRRDYEYAKTQKAETANRFVMLDNYYNNRHYTARQMAELAERHNIPFRPPVLPDAYIQVESQIEPDVPDFQFKGRDDDLDSYNAKMREDVVRFICYNNHLDDMNPDQERALGKLGNAFWKVGFDDQIQGPGYIGDIVIGDPDPANIFPDPAAYDLEDCEYLIYAYRMHRRAARRRWGEIIDDISSDANHGDTEIYESATRDIYDDTLQVIEYWYRDDAGDIACSICVNETEVQHIEKYWVNTAESGNKLYPFVKYCKTPNTKNFWDRGDIDAIKDLIDAADREFMNALLNSAMLGNDIILEEEGAFADGVEPVNMPGARWKVKTNKISAVRRLGGITNNSNSINMINFIHDKIEEVNGNFATKGAEVPSRVNTASGLAMIREDREKRSAPKKIDRVGGFRRLYELIDWTALEFYTTDRIVLIRGKNGEPDRSMTFNSDLVKQPVPTAQSPIDFLPGEEPQEQPETQYYYPRIDCEINVGQGIAKSPALTLQATQELTKIPVNPVNIELVCSMIDLMGLNNGNQIKDSLRQAVQPQQAQAPGGPGGPGGSGGPGLGMQRAPGPEEIEAFLDSLPEEIGRALYQALPQEKLGDVVQALMQIPPEQLPQAVETLLGGGGQPGHEPQIPARQGEPGPAYQGYQW